MSAAVNATAMPEPCIRQRTGRWPILDAKNNRNTAHWKSVRTRCKSLS